MTASQRASLHLRTFKGKAKVYTCQTCKRSCNLLLALLQSPTANGEQNPKSLGWHEEVPVWPLLSFLFLECFLVSPPPGQQELPSYSNWHTSKRGRTCLPTDSHSALGPGRCPGEGNGHPLQYSGLDYPMDREAWWATAHGVATVRCD